MERLVATEASRLVPFGASPLLPARDRTGGPIDGGTATVNEALLP